jgi:hypothetical protein
MALVVGVVVLVTANYWQLVRRFPKGGGAAAAAGRALGSTWTFLPIGALIVDFVLTVGISISAAASAVIALLPGLAPLRIVFALVLLPAVAGLTWFGHGGRLLFAAMTAVFVVVCVAVLILGFANPHTLGTAPSTPHPGGHSAVLAVVLAFAVKSRLTKSGAADRFPGLADRVPSPRLEGRSSASAGLCRSGRSIVATMTKSERTKRHLPTSPFEAPVVPPPKRFAVGNRVTHDVYGLGRVTGVEDGVAVLVDFGARQERIASPYAKLTVL